MQRRVFLSTLLAPSFIAAQSLQSPFPSPIDSVAVYLIPTDGISEDGAGSVARALSKTSGLWIKSSMWVPAGEINAFPDTNQYPGDDYLPIGIKISRSLPDTNARTYFIVLTDRDINSRSQNFRFQFSLHNISARTSVFSIARLLYKSDGERATDNVIGLRVQKMLMRIIGEMRLGWKRTTDPNDLMYAPIMSLDDVDKMSLVHSIQVRKER